MKTHHAASLHGDAKSQFKRKIIQLIVLGVGSVAIKNTEAERKVFHQYQQILHHNTRFKITFFHGFKFHTIVVFRMFQPSETDILAQHDFRIIHLTFPHFSKTMPEKQVSERAGQKLVWFHGGELLLAVEAEIDMGIAPVHITASPRHIEQRIRHISDDCPRLKTKLRISQPLIYLLMGHFDIQLVVIELTAQHIPDANEIIDGDYRITRISHKSEVFRFKLSFFECQTRAKL